MSETSKPKTGSLLVVLTVVFVDLLGFGMVIPLIALYGKHFGAGILELAILGSIYSLMQFFFSPLWGSLSDRFGRRPIILISLLGSSLSYLVFALAPNLLWLLISRAFAGVFTANISTAHAYVTDCTSTKERTKYMGFVGAAIGLGFTIGPPFGGISAKWLGLAAPGYIASAICALNLLAACFVLPESLVRENRDLKKDLRFINLDFRALREAMGLPMLRVFLLAGFITTLAFSHLEQAFSLFLQAKLILSTEEAAYKAGMLMLCMGVLGIVIQGGLIRPLSDKFGEKKLLITGTFLSAAALPVFAQSNSFEMFLLTAVPLAIGTALVNPCLASLISKTAPTDKLGESFGVAQGLSSLARVFGPFSGLAAFGIMAALPFYIGAVLYGVLFVYLFDKIAK